MIADQAQEKVGAIVTSEVFDIIDALIEKKYKNQFIMFILNECITYMHLKMVEDILSNNHEDTVKQPN